MTDPTAVIPTPPDNASMAEDFIDIFVAPAKVFARRTKASPMVPYLTVCIVMIVLFFASKNALQPIFDAMIHQQQAAAMKSNPQLTQDMLDKSKPFTNIAVNISGVVIVPIGLLLVGLITWVIGRFIMGGAFAFGTALLIVSYSWFPKILGSIIGIVEGVTMDVSKMTSLYQLSISAARFVDPASMSTGMYQLLAQVDLFSIWGTVLIAIGLMYAGKLDKSKATITAVIMFVCGCVPALIAVAVGK
jgi:hypothetical protein